MAEVQVKFKVRFKEPLLSHVKTWTSRTEPLGKVGDTFRAFGRWFRIEQVFTMKLSEIAHDHWKDEGCTSEGDFIAVWQWIHPRRGWQPDFAPFVHVVKDIGSQYDDPDSHRYE